AAGLRPNWLVLMVIALATIAGLAPAAARSSDTPAVAHEQIRPLLVKHCQGCHGTDQPEGDFSLEMLAADLASPSAREPWQAILHQLDAGAMPPVDQPRPPEQELAKLRQLIAGMLRDVELADRSIHGRVVLRRLNRMEYENTIRDLLRVQVKLKAQLPSDGSADGFDNAAAALHTSSFLLERYLDAADVALDRAIANRP